MRDRFQLHGLSAFKIQGALNWSDTIARNILGVAPQLALAQTKGV